MNKHFTYTFCLALGVWVGVGAWPLYSLHRTAPNLRSKNQLQSSLPDRLERSIATDLLYVYLPLAGSAVVLGSSIGATPVASASRPGGPVAPVKPGLPIGPIHITRTNALRLSCIHTTSLLGIDAQNK